MIDLLKNEDKEIFLHIFSSIAFVADFEEDNACEQIFKFNVTPVLLSVLKGNNPRLYLVALRIIGNLVFIENAMVVILILIQI